MGKIIILDENTSNKIAAGEVVDKPASVVKELLENSIDAGAGSITIEIKNGGIPFIKVTDNGSGIDEDDVEIAFERHATSKIRNADDLETISSMGFRGEALASIAAVSEIQLATRVQTKPHGTFIEVKGGSIIDVKQIGCPVGTTITIRNLFYNTPARFKFLKKDTTEAGYISDIISRIALGNPQVSFRFMSNGIPVLHTPGNNDLLSAIFSIYGKDTAKEVYQVNYEDNRIRISGFAGKPEIARSNRNYQSLYINRRFVKSKVITAAIDESYTTFLMKNKYAFIVLNIDVNPMLVDVNVHPSKMEIKFSNEQDIFRAVYNAVSSALLSQSQIRTLHLENTVKNPFKLPENKDHKIEYNQQGIQFEKADIDIYRPVVKETGAVEFENPKVKTTAVEKVRETQERYEKHESQEYPESGPSGETQCKKLFEDARIIGQAFSTYILIQQDDQLLLLDQHAAHERIMYEELKEGFGSSKPMSQLLLSTIVVELTHQEIRFLEDEKSFFNRLGFEYEGFGSNSIILRAVPYQEHGGSVKEVFLEILDHVMSKERTDRHLLADEVLYTIACKAAVKANRKLDDLEIEKLIMRLSEIENPYTCPHGRPSIIKLSKYELEKMFKRIV